MSRRWRVPFVIVVTTAAVAGGVGPALATGGLVAMAAALVTEYGHGSGPVADGSPTGRLSERPPWPGTRG